MSAVVTETMIRAANPVPKIEEPPVGAVDRATVLAGLGEPLLSDRSDFGSSRNHVAWGRVWLAAGAAAVVVFALIGAVALWSTGGADVVDQPSPSTLATTTTETSDRDTAREDARGPVFPRDATSAQQPDAIAPTAGTPLPDFGNVLLQDDGARLPLGAVLELPNQDRLHFLFETCDGAGFCVRDARFADPANPTAGSGPWPAGRPFHVRHGFPVDGPEAYGPEFDVAIYAFPLNAPGEGGGAPLGSTLRFTSDFVLRGPDDACGPAYRTQTAGVECEWFVHDFPEGLPEGRWALWAVWEAPCWAWIDLGVADSCVDRDEVVSFFSSGVDSPFVPPGSGEPRYVESDAGALRRRERG